jgi:hypothetical protein
MSTKNLLDRVRDKLARKKGAELFALEAATGISYDTLLRIRDSKTDPAFSKVQTLAVHFGVKR